jgi:hypothetical protein
MSLQNYMSCLSTDNLKILHDDLVNAGIAFDTKGDWRAIFKKRRAECSGKRKKIYAGLSKARRDDINAMINLLVEMLPKGINNAQVKS